MGRCLFMRKGSAHTVHGSRLPYGYTELAYIQSSGTQCIDTGFKHNQNTRVVMDAQVTTAPSAHAWLFEGRISNASAAKSLFLLNGTTWTSDYNSNSNRASFSGIGATSRVSVDYNKNVLTINGNKKTWTQATFQSDYNLVIFAANTGGTIAGYISAKLYSCQIYDNDVLVRDFVPCINASGEVGLYDLVGKQFYGNAGTGVFIGSEVA